MAILRTAKGTEIECESAIRGRQYPVLHIYTHDITPVEAYQIFSDSEATETLTYIEEKLALIEMEDGTHVSDLVPSERVFHGFTEIYSVQKASLFTEFDNEILIWLQRPDEEIDD